MMTAGGREFQVAGIGYSHILTMMMTMIIMMTRRRRRRKDRKGNGEKREPAAKNEENA